MSKENKGIIYVILSAILFGLMPIIASIAYNAGSNAYTVAFYRFFFGSIMLMIISLKNKYSLKVSIKQLCKLFILSLFFFSTVVLLYSSYNYIDTGLATTLHFSYPIIVMLLATIIFKEKFTKIQLLCLVLCISGMLLLYSPSGDINILGIILSLVSGFTYACYILYLGKSHLQELQSTVISFYMTLFASIEVYILTLFNHQFVYRVQPSGWFAHFTMAFLTIVLAVVLFQKGVFLCGETKASLLSTFEPLTGVFVGIFVMNEILTLKEGIGILLILLATIVIVLPKKD